PGGEEGDRDAETDQQHHPRLAGLDLVVAAGEEGLASPEVHDGAQDRSDPQPPPSYLVAVEHAEHRRAHDRRDTQLHHEPKPAQEHLHVVTMVVSTLATVAATLAVLGMGVVAVVGGGLCAAALTAVMAGLRMAPVHRSAFMSAAERP